MISNLVLVFNNIEPCYLTLFRMRQGGGGGGWVEGGDKKAPDQMFPYNFYKRKK